uniref:Uncharacterized protein n=1 Tax=Phlebotomus papatasi TaxID=29031 RepID=A0A1B0GP77_PHLPP
MSVAGEEEVEDAELQELCRNFGVEELYEGLLAKKVTVEILKNADLMDIGAFLPSDATRVIFKSHWRKWKAALPDSLNPEECMRECLVHCQNVSNSVQVQGKSKGFRSIWRTF